MAAKNQLIEWLPAPERARVLALAEPVALVEFQKLFEIGTTTSHVYFPTQGYVSLLSAIDEGSVLEVSMVGVEGMLGVHVALNARRSPLQALVQAGGTALRIPVMAFKRELASNDALRAGINRYIAVLMSQLVLSASCTRFHAIGPRLARWLLMSQDRVGADRFFMTHELLSTMLGVRREGVTSAASTLQSKGLIDYHRGNIHVLDRAGLEAASCSCYASDRASYATLIR